MNIKLIIDPFDLLEETWLFEFPPEVKDFNKLYYQIEASNTSVTEKIIKLKKLINECPLHLDSYNYLGINYLRQNKVKSALSIWQKSFEIIMDSIPEEFIFEKNKINYYILDNRPFFRTFYNYAFILIVCGDEKKHKTHKLIYLLPAIFILETLVNVWENDNIGARQLLPFCYLMASKYKELLALSKKYEETNDFELEYGSILAALKLSNKKAETICRRAITNNPWVAEIILSQKKIHHGSKKIFNYYDYYDATLSNESVFWNTYGQFWDEEAISFLSKFY